MRKSRFVFLLFKSPFLIFRAICLLSQFRSYDLLFFQFKRFCWYFHSHFWSSFCWWLLRLIAILLHSHKISAEKKSSVCTKHLKKNYRNYFCENKFHCHYVSLKEFLACIKSNKSNLIVWIPLLPDSTQRNIVCVYII